MDAATVTVLTGVGSAIVGAGILQAVTSWIKARAKRVSDEGDAIKVRAKADAQAQDREVTARVKTLEAEAEATKVEAAKDQAILDDVAALRKEVRECEDARENERKWCHDQIAELRGRLDVLWDRSGLTPKDLPKVTP